MISIHTAGSTKRAVKKEASAKSYWNFLKGALPQATRRNVDDQKAKLDIENDNRYDVFKIAKEIVKTNQDIISEWAIRNDDGVLSVNDKDKKIAKLSES